MFEEGGSPINRKVNVTSYAPFHKLHSKMPGCFITTQ